MPRALPFRWDPDCRNYDSSSHPHHQVMAPPVDPYFGLTPQPVPQGARQEMAAAAPPAFDSGERFLCERCGKVFVRRQALLSHWRTHGARRFICGYCGAAFQQRGHLTKHTRTHTGERPYPCQVCQRRFTQKTHLVEHIRIHTGERPYRFVIRACVPVYFSSFGYSWLEGAPP